MYFLKSFVDTLPLTHVISKPLLQKACAVADFCKLQDSQNWRKPADMSFFLQLVLAMLALSLYDIGQISPIQAAFCIWRA